ncbi:YfjI family protein [Citrobacter sp. Cpo012]|uniref:DUF3987 domain-containing protein n=1 Tax=Citrobacter sp. Cpo012 TaxID=2985120 RepID=UPI0025766A46|nr:DUF3987 domain-containing protein [Citrobacter sp. Cpo012]MDM2910380.1 YfjI family protein [Citrobacter sp. Cpo012]
MNGFNSKNAQQINNNQQQLRMVIDYNAQPYDGDYDEFDNRVGPLYKFIKDDVKPLRIYIDPNAKPDIPDEYGFVKCYDRMAIDWSAKPTLYMAVDWDCQPYYGEWDEFDNKIESAPVNNFGQSAFNSGNQQQDVQKTSLHINSSTLVIDNANKPKAESLGKDKNNESDELCGLGQYIYECINGAGRRELKPASKMAALQALSAMSPKIKGYNNVTMGLLTFTVCESGAGKEKPQEFFDDIAVSAGMAAADAPTSNKSIYMDIFHGKGRAAFVVDEVHEMLNGMRGIGSKKSEHANGMEGSILKLSTKHYAKLSPTYAKEICNSITNEINSAKKRIEQFKKNLDEDGNVINKDIAESRIDKIQKSIEYKKEMIKKIRSTKRIDDIRLNLFGSSTPREMRPHINKRSIQSGFLGRVIMGWSDKVNPLREPYSTEMEKEMIMNYAEWVSSREGQITTDNESKRYLDEVMLNYDTQQYREHKDYAPLYRRVYENTCRIASLLAVGNFDLQITLAQAKAAFKIVLDSLNAIITLCEASGSESEQYEFENEIEAKVYTVIDKNKNQHGYCYLSILRDKLFNGKKISSMLNRFKLTVERFMNKLVSSDYLSIADANKKPAYKLEPAGINRMLTLIGAT